MPLKRYSLLIGKAIDFLRDDESEYGNYFHGHIIVASKHPVNRQEVKYRCAVDVKEPNGNVLYIFLNKIEKECIANVIKKENTVYNLQEDKRDALDYIRHNLLKQNKINWVESNGRNTLLDVESYVANSTRVFIFGELFYNFKFDEYGLHDIHMNQGDPLPSKDDPDYKRKMGWYKNSGIWQDGGVIFNDQNNNYHLLLLKFKEQSMNTDENGHPI